MYVKEPNKLRRRRKDKGFSQQQLAALVGCTQQYISLMEAGDDRDCSEKIAERVSRWLDCELEDLFDERQVVHMPSIPSDQPVDGISA
jgi:putative transcriptional regulator